MDSTYAAKGCNPNTYSKAHSVADHDSTQSEMKKLFALLVALLLVLSSGAMAQNFNFPDSPTLDQVVTGPGGQQFRWDGTRWISLSGAGGGPYLPLAGGTMTGPVSNMTALGIGQATVATDLLDVTNNVNAAAGAVYTNSNTGANAFAGWIASNGTSSTVLEMTGTGYTSNPNVPANMGALVSNGVNGVGIFALQNTPTAPVKIWADGNYIATFGGTPIGTEFNYPVGIGVVPPTAASGVLLQGTLDANVANTILLTNANAGNQAGTAFSMQTGSGANIYPTTFYALGAGNTGNPFFPVNSAVIATSEPNGLWIGTNIPNDVINFYQGAAIKVAINQTSLVSNETYTSQVNPATQTTFDANNSTVTVAGGANVALPACAGLVLINEQIVNGAVCLYLTGRGSVTLISQQGNWCAANTTAPPAGEYSLAYNGTTYAIYSAAGNATAQFGVMNFCTRRVAFLAKTDEVKK